MTARRFSPIFTATITPSSVSTRTAKNGNKYSVLPQANVARAGHEDRSMTVMAFGKSRDEVAKLLRKGKSVDLAVQFDGGSLKVIGRPRPAAVAA